MSYQSKYTGAEIDAGIEAAKGALPKSGGTMTGDLILNNDPTSDKGAATKQYVDNAVNNVASTPGSNGTTFTPSVSPDGVLSWSNDGDLANPEPVNIKGDSPVKGIDYFDGEAGYTPVKGKDYFDGDDGFSPTVVVSEITGGHRITITDANGTKTVDVIDGEKGDPGYTPVKGTDYSDGEKGDNGRGIQSIKRTSGNGAAGTVDTYTITYTDETTSTFTVRNGSDGEDGLTPVKGVDYFDGANGYSPVKGKDYFDGDDGYTPVKGVDYYTTADKAEFEAQIASEMAKRAQIEPEYAESIEGCTDTTKMYVLPDGFIYAYLYQEATGPSYTNLSETVHENYRMGSGGTLSALTGAITTDFIPVRKGQTVRFKGFNPLALPSSKYPYICFYTGASESNVVSSGVWDRLDWLEDEGYLKQDASGVWSYTAFKSPENAGGAAGYEHALASSITHIRMCGTMLSGETVVVTVDEEITDGGSQGGYVWMNTGHAFVPADYETEILALQKNKADKTAIPTKLPNPHALTIDGVKYDGSAAVNIETQSGGNILYGKKWVACGDSFTENGYNASDGVDQSVYIYQDGRFAGRYKVYPFIIGLRNNMNIVNLATGGQTMATSSNSFMTRYASIDADADYITLMFGINDKLQGVSLGAIDSTDKATFCGAFNVAMEHILTNHPFAHVGIMVSHGTNAEIMEATRDIAERWGVPYLDYGSPQVPLMHRYTGRWVSEGGKVCDKAREIREKNFCISSDGTTPTNAHPNTAAHEYESTFIEAWLRTL